MKGEMKMRKELLCALFMLTLLAAIMPAMLVEASPGGSIVGLWHFDTVDITVTPNTTPDSSGQGNTGNLYPISDGPTLVLGKFGNALSFDGDDYVEVAHSTSMDVSDRYTFEAWVYLTDESDYRGLFRRGTQGVVASEIEIYIWPGPSLPPPYARDRRLVVVHNRGTSDFCYRYYTPVPLNEWVHIAVTWDGTTERAYYNGVEETSVGGTTMVDPGVSDKPSFIGLGYYTCWMPGGTPYMIGDIDEVRIWSVALTDTEIADSYALGTTTTITEPRAIVELGEEFLPDGGVAIFTSAFYWPSTGAWTFPVTLEARVMIVGSDATVTDCLLRGVTPKGSVTYVCTVVTDGCDVTVSAFIGKAKSLHLAMVLSGTTPTPWTQWLGFNIQNLPYD